MKHRILLILGVLFATLADAQTATWEWRGLSMDPCSMWINCDTGCSACQTPTSTSPSLMPVGAAFIGPQPCPHPIDTAANNALFLYDWPAVPDSSSRVIFSLLSLVPTQIDTIQVRAWRSVNGPDHIRIDGNWTTIEPGAYLPPSWYTLTLTDLGCMPVPDGGIFGVYQFQLQPFGGGSDAIAIDYVRVVASECLTTGLEPCCGGRQPQVHDRTSFDVLGRQVSGHVEAGAYTTLDGVRRIVLLP